MSGVPVHELHCPTCGAWFGWPLEIHQPEPIEVTSGLGLHHHLLPPREPPHIECPHGHRWTLKTHFRREGEPDALLLGDYIGGGWT